MLRVPSGHMTLSGAVCELHHSGVLQGRLQAIQQCALCRLRLALALQIEAHPAGNKLHPADVSTE